jgi:hypothetical protein
VPWPPASAGPRTNASRVAGSLNWSSYTWLVKESYGFWLGPGNNVFSSSGDFVWTDARGLHLNILQLPDGRWGNSEVFMSESLGYGTYLVRCVGDMDELDVDVAWSPLFIWSDPPDGIPANGYREIDFEFARWGNVADPTSGQFVVEPLKTGGMLSGWRKRYTTPSNILPIIDTGAVLGRVSKVTHVLRWQSNVLQWLTFAGLWTLDDVTHLQPIAAYTYPSPLLIPTPSNAGVRANLWCFNEATHAPRNGVPVHVVLQGFDFTTEDTVTHVHVDINIVDASV